MSLRETIWPEVPDSLWHDWRWQWKNRLSGKKGLRLLSRVLDFDHALLARVIDEFKWASTPYYIDLIDPMLAMDDPVARQVVPSVEELAKDVSCSPDPLQERKFSPIRGLVHRYHDRAVILASPSCASYCRHCNRKRTWKRPESLSFSHGFLDEAVRYIRSRPSIREVIVSGGDPLLLPLERLDRLLTALGSAQNVEVLRIGTRIPVVMPMKVTERLCAILEKHRPIWLNTHFNHPKEMTPLAIEAIERIQLAGIPVSNQTVLLKGVNDDFHVLRTLFCRLQARMVRPYYLFQCDHVTGTKHFRTPLSKGIAIMEKMWGDVGGMCVPRFVADLPGGGGKARLMPSQILENGSDGEAVFYTFEGKIVKVTF